MKTAHHNISMNRFALTIIMTMLVVAGFGQNIPAKPNPPRLVNDLAGILTQYQVDHLEERLVAYDDSTSVQIAVVTIPSLGGANAADFAIELGRQWGVGNKKTNNGVVVLMSKEDRKIFIAPGYGLEAALPDITCKAIIDREILPAFREGNFYKGFEKGTDAIIEATRGRYTAPEGYGKRGGGSDGSFVFVIIVVLVLILLFIGRKGGGGDGGDAMSRRGHRHLDRTPPFIFFPPIGGGGRGGWGGGGGGFGGGGFGGFGGGSFGGGGAGGSW
ncbi:MAG TPA: TPM domain-containing protein [Phnomibacter sp.]|nr:TPM domain-containing protein [Phnomibacter sp.]